MLVVSGFFAPRYKLSVLTVGLTNACRKLQEDSPTIIAATTAALLINFFKFMIFLFNGFQQMLS